MKGNGGQRTRLLAPSITLLNEQRTATGHRLILINGDMWHSEEGSKLTLGAINLVLCALLIPKIKEKQ